MQKHTHIPQQPLQHILHSSSPGHQSQHSFWKRKEKNRHHQIISLSGSSSWWKQAEVYVCVCVCVEGGSHSLVHMCLCVVLACVPFLCPLPLHGASSTSPSILNIWCLELSVCTHTHNTSSHAETGKQGNKTIILHKNDAGCEHFTLCLLLLPIFFLYAL